MNNTKHKLMGLIAAALLPFAVPGAANAGLNDGLAGYWTFDEGVGIVANDVSGNANTGAIHGASYGPGHVNTGLGFNGAGDFVGIPDFGAFTNFSVSAFVDRTGATSQRETVVSYKEGSFPNCGFVLGLNEDGASQFPQLIVNVNGTWQWAESTTPVPLNVGVHLGGTYDGNTIKLFVNGVLAASTFAPGTMTQCTQAT